MMPQTTIPQDSSPTASSPGFLDALMGAAKAFKENLQTRFAPTGQLQAAPGSVLGNKNDQLQAMQPQQPYSALQQNAPMLDQPMLSHSQNPYGSAPGEQRIDTAPMTGFTNIKRPQ